MNYDNPAARLLAILIAGKQIDGATRCRVAWERILKADQNPPLLMSRLGKVMELPNLAVTELQEQFPNDGDMWSHWLSQVNGAFLSQNLLGDWNSFNAHIDSHTMTYLKMSSNLLQGKATTKLIADNELAEIRLTLMTILNSVLESDQPSEVKKYLHRAVMRLVISIDEYALTGAMPILGDVERMLGHAVTDRSYKSFLFDSELGKKLLDTMSACANVVGIAVGIPQLSVAIDLLRLK